MTSRLRLTGALLTLLCYGVRVVWSSCSNVTALSARLDAALSEYDREVAPRALVRVQMSLDMRHATINEHTSTLRMLADLHMSWQDSRVAWNASELGCDWGLVSAERLWLPDVILVNAAASSTNVEPLRARLSSEGSIVWANRLDVSIPVEFKLEYWPNDVQTGVFKFASRAHATDEIELLVREEQHALVFEPGSWEIMEVISSRSTVPAAEGGGRLRRVASWSLELRRRAPAQVLAARVMLTAAVLLLIAAALLPASQRAPLAAASAFTTALWLCVSAWRVGGGSTAPRSLSAAAGLCAVGALGAAGAALCTRVATLVRPAPPGLRAVLAATTRYWSFTPQADGGAGSAASGGESGVWAAAARLLDVILLLTLAFTLFIILVVYL